MKNKKLWIGLAVLALALIAVLVIGLTHIPGTGDGKEPAIQLPASELAVEVTLDQTQASLGVGGTLWLKAETKNTQQTVLWESSAPEVATVWEGEVTALKEGTAVITASVGNVKAECTVVVSSDAPALLVSDAYVVVDIGGSYTVNAEVTMKGKAYEEPVSYQWSAGTGADAFATVQAQGNTAVFTGVAYGDAEFYVSTQVGGVSLTKRVTVVCCDTKIVMNADGAGVAPTVGGFTLSLELGKTGKPQITVYNGDEKLKNPPIKWSSDKPAVAKVASDGTITALKEGTAVITARYGDKNNHIRFFVSVYRPVYPMKTRYTIETAVGTLTLTDKLEGTITDVSINGQSVLESISGDTITLKASALPTVSSLMGQGRPLVIDTDRAKYTYSADVYSKIITTAQEFQNMASYLARLPGDNGWAQYNGYIVLGSDIDLQGAAFELFPAEAWSGSTAGTDMNAAMGFNGVLDGQGHAVSNYTATAGNNALFSYLGAGGVIRNVSFTDISAPATTGNIVTRVINGAMRDVYISIRSWENGAVLAHSYRSGRYLQNVVIEYTGPQIEGVRDVVGHWGTPPTYFVHYPPNIKNVYVIGNITTMETNCKEHGGSCGFHVYQNLAQMKAAGNSYAGFSRDFWNLDSGLPTAQQAYDQRVGTDVTVQTTETLLSAGDQVTLKANVEYVTWKIEHAPAGVTLQGNVLTVAEGAALGEIKLIAANVFNGQKTDTCTMQVVDMSRQSLEDMGDLELNDTKGQTSVSLDLSKATAFTQVAGIKVGDREIPVGSVSGNQVSVATEDLKPFLGQQVEFVLTCQIDGGYNKVTLPATVVSKVITSAAEFKAMADYMDRTQGDNNYVQYTGYVVLGNDISLAGSAFELFPAEVWSGTAGSDYMVNLGFNGILNGRGYAVSGYTATAGNNALFSNIGKSGLIENISFTDVAAPAGTGNILTRTFNGKMLDVYISVKDWREGNLLNHSYRDGRFMENVVIEYTGQSIDGLRDITGHWGEANYYVHYPNNIKNVYILGDIATIQTNCAEHGDVDCGFHVYKTLEELEAAGSSFAAFPAARWNTSAGLPVPVKLFNKWSSTDITVTNPKVDGNYELIKGNFMALTANVSYVDWQLVGSADGVTLQGNVLTAGADTAAQSITVKASNRYNSEKSVTITVQLVTSQNKTLEKLGYLEVLGQSYAYVDLAESKTVTAITGVSINGKAVPAGSFGLDAGRLKLAVAQLQEHVGKSVSLEISYKAGGGNVIAACQVELVVSKAIKTFADLSYLNSVTTPNLDGYFIVANDIDCKHQNIAAGSTWGNGFQGILDGQGHTISNLKLGDGSVYTGIFGAISGGTVRNLTFDGVSFGSRASLFGRVISNKAGTTQKTTVENVTVNVAGFTGTSEVGIFAFTITANTKFINVTVNVAPDVTVGNLFGSSFNTGNVEGSVVVNLDSGSDITYYHDASKVKPDIVTVNKAVSEELDTLVAGENTTSVTLQNAAFTADSASVSVNGQTKTVAITQSGKLTVDLADFGVTQMGRYTLTVTLGSSKYTYTQVWYVTQVIDTVAELKALGAKCKTAGQTGYYILGADINCASEANMAVGNPGWAVNGLQGTFDGRGKTISNIKMMYDSTTSGYGGLFGNVLGATIKNVTFDKVNYASVNVALFGRHTVDGNGKNTTIENVTVNIAGWAATGEAGLFSSRGARNTIYNNVVVNVADGLTLHNLLGCEWNSNHGTGIKVNLGEGSKVTAFYWTGTADTTAVKTPPSIVKINMSAVEETTDALVAAENTKTLTISNSGFTTGNASVTINGQTKSVAITADGKLSVNLADFGVSSMGQYSAVVETAAGKYTYNEVWYVTQVIDTVAELKALGAKCKTQNVTGYYILGGNINCSSEANMAVGNPGWQANGFSGTFNGRGKTISNIKMMYDSTTGGYGGLFGNLAGCTIKNVVFDKVNYATVNVSLLGRHAYASNGSNVTLENLTVNVSAWGATGEAGVLVSRGTRNTLHNGIKINVAAGVTVHNLLGCEWNSNYGTGITLSLGTGSTITSYYWTGTSDTTAVTTKPTVIQ